MSVESYADYEPNPIDTSYVTLSNDLLALTELLAENAHEIWAKGRKDEGWRYGPVRDDNKKEHPDYRPYSELPESEREYDRRSALETLKVIVALGYRIDKRRDA